MISIVWLGCILAVVAAISAEQMGFSPSSSSLGWSSGTHHSPNASSPPSSPEVNALATTAACGGTLTAARGVIHTPNFPDKFPVPIHCTWIIDASSIATSNVSIAIYFTQQFVLSGLKFTQYNYYSYDYKVIDDSAHEFKLNEQNVSTVSSVRFNIPFLQIQFSMSSLHGTHLRALDRLLDVYGFNITYEINSDMKRYQCNPLRCRYLGHCYADQNFT